MLSDEFEIFENLNIVGGIAGINDENRIRTLFKLLNNRIYFRENSPGAMSERNIILMIKKLPYLKKKRMELLYYVLILIL